jgi:hypothetical protein
MEQPVAAEIPAGEMTYLADYGGAVDGALASGGRAARQRSTNSG